MDSWGIFLFYLLASPFINAATPGELALECLQEEEIVEREHRDDALNMLQISAIDHRPMRHASVSEDENPMEQNVSALRKGSHAIGKWNQAVGGSPLVSTHGLVPVSGQIEDNQGDKPWGYAAGSKDMPTTHTVGINANNFKPRLPGSLTSKDDSCVQMINEEDYFTVDVHLGTPPQTVGMVADTGSTLFVAESCFCKKDGDCKTPTKCFKGRGFSSTFNHNKYRPLTTLTYGSGDITVMKAGDIARVGNVVANMSGALMLMMQSTMNIAAPEGVLGLGIPDPTAGAKGFLEKAKVDRFRLCFNDGGGSLRFHTEHVGEQLRQVGTSHWALDLTAVSIGYEPFESVSLGICDPQSKKQFQNTACAAIPDSGTTFILMPPSHLTQVFASFCDQWERCAAMTRYSDPQAKQKTFVRLLEACEDWLVEDKGIDEIPNMHLHFMGAKGNKTQLATLSPWSFIMEYPVDDKPKVLNSLHALYGGSKVTVASNESINTNSGRTKECVPTFAPVDYGMEATGALWIIGTPLFYEYTMGFDLTTSPASVSFSDSIPCGNCNEDHALFSKGSGDVKPARLGKQHSTARRLRRIKGKPRFPHIDLNKPL